MNGFRKLWDRVLKVAVAATATCAGVLLGVWCLHQAGKFQALELWVYDTMLQLHVQPKESGSANDIVIVGIDDYDIRLLNNYPLFDAEKAALLKALEQAHVRVIGVDLYMDIPTGGNDSDTRDLQNLLSRNGNIVCGYLVSGGTVENPKVLPPLGAGGVVRLTGRRIGCVDQPTSKKDDVCRRGLLYATDRASSSVQPVDAAQSLSVGVANKFLEATNVLPVNFSDPAHLKTFWNTKLHQFHSSDGGYVGADDTGFQYLIDYRGPARSPIYKLRQIISFPPAELGKLPADGQLPAIDASVLKDKIVLIGATADSLNDFIATPLFKGYDHFGVEQHAHLVDQLLRTARGESVPLRVWSGRLFWSWTAFWAVLGTIAGLSARLGYSPRAPWRLIVIGIAGEIALLGISALLFAKGTWVPMVPPSICWVATISIVGAYISQLERTDRNVLNNLFVKICQAEIATELWKRRDEILDGGKLKPKRLSATLMFSDLHGFSTECEKMDENLIIKWLNRYHDAMSSIVSRYHGVTVKYMGDGMMAVFGAPRTSGNGQMRKEDARNAVNCALEMRKKMKELHAEWASQHLPCLAMRIGIQSGAIVEGSLGSASRMEYVMLGDTVNVASRLESLDKKIMDEDITGGVCRIVIGEQTYEIVKGQFQLRSFPNHEIRGRAKLMDVYGVTTDNQPGQPVIPE